MRFYDITFMCYNNDDELPKCKFHSTYIQLRDIEGTRNAHVTFHVEDESGLIAFKNNVLWAFEEYMRNKLTVQSLNKEEQANELPSEILVRDNT